LAHPISPIRTAIYVDGFNLYYWLRNSPFRWVDLKDLVLGAIARPDKQNKVVALKYFTARVKDTAEDPHKATRQDVYIRALKAVIPELTVYYGEFRRQQKWMPRALPSGATGSNVAVWDTEEKGSDVNLAVELLNDAWSNIYDLAIVVSNDSDLEHALQLARKRSKTVGVLVRGDAVVNSLRRVANFSKKLTFDDVRGALLPREIRIPASGATIRIPDAWRHKEDVANIRS
jgi:hypothetical protein